MSISRFTSSRKWVELATSSPTSGTTVTLSSLAEYDKYRIVCLGLSASSAVSWRINNDTGNNYYLAANETEWDYNKNNTTNAFNITNTNLTCDLIIDSANDAVYKSITGWAAQPGNNTAAYEVAAIWSNTATVDRIDFITAGTFSSGSITIYGAND